MVILISILGVALSALFLAVGIPAGDAYLVLLGSAFAGCFSVLLGWEIGDRL